MLTFLSAGGFLTTSCAAARLNYRVIYEHCAEGLRDDGSPECRQIAEEVFAALGKAGVLAESGLRERSPLEWLRSGPRTLISREWSEQADIKSPMTDAVPAAEISAPPTNSITADVCAALIELHKAGIIHVEGRTGGSIIDSTAAPAK